MIRFGGIDSKGRAILGLALGPENLERLKDGQPIVMDGATVGYEAAVVWVVYADRPEDALKQLEKAAKAAGGRSDNLTEILEAMKDTGKLN